MKKIDRTGRFKKDFKREFKGRHRSVLDHEMRAALDLLLSGQPLPERFVDHALTGEWKGHRDCHIRPDLVLIYRWADDGTLILTRLGSHSELEL